ncbi:MAG: hypothetical protein DMG80_11180 [Acidobacteria bacterium]|nr:MAG: hypothetical protein DMG80_11180 [Acidobacteriota bacterium]
MMLGLGGTIGVAHHDYTLGLMQADRHANLFEDEILLEVVARRSESLGAPGDDDQVGTLDTLLLHKFSHGPVDAMVEAAEQGGVGYVRVGGGIEMEDLLHEMPHSFYPLKRVVAV